MGRWEKEIELDMAAAGYKKKKILRRKPRVKIDLNDPAVLYAIKLRAAQKILESVDGNRRKAAKRLGIHVRTLYKWLKEIEKI